MRQTNQSSGTSPAIPKRESEKDGICTALEGSIFQYFSEIVEEVYLRDLASNSPARFVQRTV